MSYKYRVFLKSGASFDVETDSDVYEDSMDAIEDHLGGNYEDAPCFFTTLYLNKSAIAFINKKEIAAIIALSSGDNENTEHFNDDEREKFLSMPFIDLSGMRLEDTVYLPNLTGRVLNRIEVIQNAKGELLTLSELLEFRVNDLLEIEFCGKKTVDEITDFLHLMSKHTNLSFTLRHHRTERTPFVESILKTMGKH